MYPSSSKQQSYLYSNFFFALFHGLPWSSQVAYILERLYSWASPSTLAKPYSSSNSRRSSYNIYIYLWRRTRTKKKDDGYVQVSFSFFFLRLLRSDGRRRIRETRRQVFRYHDDRKGGIVEENETKRARKKDNTKETRAREREREKKDAGPNTCPVTQEPTYYCTIAPSPHSHCAARLLLKHYFFLALFLPSLSHNGKTQTRLDNTSLTPLRL